MIGKIFSVIFNLVMLPVLSGLFIGIFLYISLEFKKVIEIENIVFTQANSEKYSFKSEKLQDSYEKWKRRMIKNGEIK